MTRLLPAIALGAALVAPAPPAAAQHQHHPVEQQPDRAAPPSGTPAADHYADRDFPAAAMRAARATMMREQGGQRLYQLRIDSAEYRSGSRGFAWDGTGFIGSDLDRFYLKSKGETRAGHGAERAEIQALASHAIGPYFNVQLGIRHDFRPAPGTSYGTIAIEGLAPYMFETEAALFVATDGDMLARLGGWYDQRLTQWLVLQPRAELDLSAQDIPSQRLGSGLTRVELGARLRVDMVRSFTPYIGVSWSAATGRTADRLRAAGESTETTDMVVGLRAWF
jgi:copper resistance protein B